MTDLVAVDQRQAVGHVSAEPQALGRDAPTSGVDEPVDFAALHLGQRGRAMAAATVTRGHHSNVPGAVAQQRHQCVAQAGDHQGPGCSGRHRCPVLVQDLNADRLVVDVVEVRLFALPGHQSVLG